MNVVGHDYKSRAPGRQSFEDSIEHAQDNSFRMVMIKQLATSVNGEREKVHVKLVVNDASSGLHVVILPEARRNSHLL